MKKTAFVLSGGGAKGAFQVGVMQKLCDQGIIPDVIYGSSVGALNAAGYAHMGLNKTTEMWLNIKKKSDILSFNWYKLPWASGLHSMKPLQKILDKHIQGKPEFEAIVCKCSMNTGKVVYSSNMKESIEEFRLSTLGSSSIPVAMEPVGEWVDGGVREQVPLQKAIDDGCTKIYVILCNPITIDPINQYNIKGKTWLQNMFRAVEDLMEHETLVNDIEACLEKNTDPDYNFIELHIYSPDELLINTLEFNPEKIRAAMKQGREAQEWLGFKVSS